MNDSQSPAGMEAAVLAALDRHDAALNNYVHTFPLGASSSAMANWIGGLGPVEWGYQQLRPVCGWLEHQGLPGARRRLDAGLSNLAQARNIYIEMYNDRVQVENTQADIWRDAIRFGTIQTMAANSYQNAAAQQWLQDMFDVNEHRCFDCHTIIGTPGGGYCYKCARSRGWVY
jgi:hypothetical protein